MGQVAAIDFQAKNGTQILYAGQNYKDLTDEKLKPVFKDLDLNNDLVLSQSEIGAYKDYLELKKRSESDDCKMQSTKAKANSPVTSSIFAGIAGFITGAVTNNVVINKISDKVSENNWFNKAFFRKVVEEHFSTCDCKNYSVGDYLYTSTRYVGTRLKKGFVIGGGVLLAGLAGYGIYKLVSGMSGVQKAKEEVKQHKEKMRPIKEQIGRSNVQYRHVNELIEYNKNDLSDEELIRILFFSTIPFMLDDSNN